MPLVSVLRRQSWADLCECEANMVYIVSSRPPTVTLFKERKKKRRKQERRGRRKRGETEGGKGRKEGRRERKREWGELYSFWLYIKSSPHSRTSQAMYIHGAQTSMQPKHPDT